jgi:hypothetical protein
MNMNRLPALDAAKQFILEYFPNCHAAVLAGSVVRGEGTHTSDLDIVIFEKERKESYRESLVVYDWPIEIFVHGLTSYQFFFKDDCKRGTPSMPRMVSEGIVIKDEGVMERLKIEADKLLAEGPELWSSKEMETKRYFVTDTLDDFIGCDKREETIFAANILAGQLSEFYLRTRGQWTGSSKWTVRALKNYDPEFAATFVKAFEEFYRKDDKTAVIRLVDAVLKPYGGRYFQGFLLGNK